MQLSSLALAHVVGMCTVQSSRSGSSSAPMVRSWHWRRLVAC